MAFSFGFSGDDIDEDPNDNVTLQAQKKPGLGNNVPPPVAAKTHVLDELLSTLPDKISFSTISITSPNGSTVRLPRRELFDVRLQLMAEDDGRSSNPLLGLNDSDVQTNIYEGGYKTWECSIDLAKYLLDYGPSKKLDDLATVNLVIEMGCGSALPSLLLFQHALRNRLKVDFTLTDYNFDVLRLVTLPNLLLTWVSTLDEEQSRNLFPEGGNPLLNLEIENGDVYLTRTLFSVFTNTLSAIKINISLISGSWTPVPTFLQLIPSSEEMNTFILGSETIYSPASLTAFTEAIATLMARVTTGKTIVAAKKVYFGVGGSVDGFVEECTRRGCVAREVEFARLESQGVRRCLLEVQMC